MEIYATPIITSANPAPSDANPARSDSASPPPLPEAQRQALTAAYAAIQAAHFADLPVCNPALTVEATAFQPWEAGWLGAMITPWSLMAIWVPADHDALAGLPLAGSQERLLPAGVCPFTVEEEPGIGRFLASPLFSPLHALRSQEQAREAAAVAVAVLLSAEEALPAGAGAQAQAGQTATEPASPRSPAGELDSPARRQWFRGLLAP